MMFMSYIKAKLTKRRNITLSYVKTLQRSKIEVNMLKCEHTIKLVYS